METILFESREAAQNAAYMLKGNWDGLNGVTIQQVDLAAIEFVANQVQSNCCKVKTVVNLPITIKNLNLYAKNLRDFEGVDLSYADLDGVNLEGYSFKNANLSHANLRGTNLKNANLRGANLRGANLKLANLTGVNLHSANLNKVKVSKLQLIKLLIKNIFYDLKNIGDLVYKCGLFATISLVTTMIILIYYSSPAQILSTFGVTLLFNIVTFMLMINAPILQSLIFGESEFDDSILNTTVPVQLILLFQPYLIVSQAAEQLQTPLSSALSILALVGTTMAMLRFMRVNLGI